MLALMSINAHITSLFTPGQPAVANQKFTHDGVVYKEGRKFPYETMTLRPGQLEQYFTARLIRFVQGKAPVELAKGERIYTEKEVEALVTQRVAEAVKAVHDEIAAKDAATKAAIAGEQARARGDAAANGKAAP